MRGITGGRGILGGAVLLAVGFGVLMQAMGVTDAGAYLFLFLGLAFAIAYVAGTQQYVYLVPADNAAATGLVSAPRLSALISFGNPPVADACDVSQRLAAAVIPMRAAHRVNC